MWLNKVGLKVKSKISFLENKKLVVIVRSQIRLLKIMWLMGQPEGQPDATVRLEHTYSKSPIRQKQPPGMF